jgi:hypothetical protein
LYIENVGTPLVGVHNQIIKLFLIVRGIPIKARAFHKYETGELIDRDKVTIDDIEGVIFINRVY